MPTIPYIVHELFTTTRRTKKTPSGWLSGNAPCCHHRGHRQDVKGRGGVRFDMGVSYHCFNCHYTTAWQPGRTLSYNFKQLCHWLGADEHTINQMVFEALKTERPEYNYIPSDEIITFEPIALPPRSEPIAELVDEIHLADEDLVSCIEYLISRGFDPTDGNFYWSDEIPSRVILPFFYNKEIVGYTGRKIGKGQPKYLNEKPANFVFNLDKQSQEQRYIIVCEGPFDALSISGVGLLTNAIADKQARMIESYGTEIIVVPDQDEAGLELVDQAMKRNWSVAFPNWEDGVNDVADAVLKYGKLFVLVDIIKTAVHGQIKLKVARNNFEHKLQRIAQDV